MNPTTAAMHQPDSKTWLRSSSNSGARGWQQQRMAVQSGVKLQSALPTQLQLVTSTRCLPSCAPANTTIPFHPHLPLPADLVVCWLQAKCTDMRGVLRRAALVEQEVGQIKEAASGVLHTLEALLL